MTKTSTSILLFALLVLMACSTNQSMETRVKKYMKDSVASTFKDPSSYEYVSMTIDTFKLKDYIAEIRRNYKPVINFGKDVQQNEPPEAAELEKKNADSIINYHITVKYKNKNADGASTLQDINLILDPNNHTITKPAPAN